MHGFWWSHIGWITSRRNFPTDYSQIKDLVKYPELVFLNRFDAIIPLAFAFGVWGFGCLVQAHAPGLHTTRWQMLTWGFFISTTALFHGTASINSLAHVLGRRRYQTGDDSRNSFLLAIITLGEGWHNNHHRYQSATRNGFYWWEVDITYYLLKGLSWTGLIWNLKAVPKSVLDEGAHADHHASVAAAKRAALVHPEYASLRKVVPAAAAIAVATVTAAHPRPRWKSASSPGSSRRTSRPTPAAPKACGPAGSRPAEPHRRCPCTARHHRHRDRRPRLRAFPAPEVRPHAFRAERHAGRPHQHGRGRGGRPDQLPVDTGFMVFNTATYPLLTRLFAQLRVPVKPAPMSFSVRHADSGLEFCGSSLNRLFAQRRNLFRPRFYRMLRSIDRFNREAVAALGQPDLPELTLGEYVRRGGYGADFFDLYLVPMSSAVWSTPPERMLEFPAATLLRFFANHGFLGLNTQHPWLTVTGGARTYVEKISAPWRDRVRLGPARGSRPPRPGRRHGDHGRRRDRDLRPRHPGLPRRPSPAAHRRPYRG